MRPTIEEAIDALRAAETDLLAQLKTERGRRRGALNRQLHDLRRRLRPDGYRFVSQAGQDLVVDRLFKAKRGGTFVDIGGYDGVSGSNTFFLEMFRGWTGILIEPVTTQVEAARRIRRCQCRRLAIARVDGEEDFIEISEGYTQMSGLAASYDPGLLDTVRADPRHKETVVKVPTRTLSAVLGEAGVPDPDFVSLDVEGAEIAILSEFPFDRHRVGLWSIENNTGSPRLGQIMRPAGYELIEFCGPDELWRRRDL
ncbi:FkbM family methyltransferase [Ponticoccus sp. SC2-23]|nr:FkbM family methyltransferase [Ponticoccus sp. SC6-9]MBM1225220.1 FkbM family methyltransferase [Ponticoccus sp. SC6-15]MBM1228734.1 FkbM family methyltransferase [Ponticoccus sp. SC6-38]MBM1233629.1 FkbM family methyltransferase [Ponticoccus sp. SC6-45]MBM1239235.1 FkbM family methyltransferase [Ponticoccus sp. SC6-49]MBM1243017.1 FkbM family methyltransferase [Ponticoccus sp. SC2-64]MBM1247153.1 FkbM family methyltransferase [Ponticoccus sp. SC6-42]MBM1252188.1 FkbM family methyltransfe